MRFCVFNRLPGDSSLLAQEPHFGFTEYKELTGVLHFLFLVTTLANRFTNSLMQPLGTTTYIYWTYRYGLMGWKTNQPPKKPTCKQININSDQN